MKVEGQINGTNQSQFLKYSQTFELFNNISLLGGFGGPEKDHVVVLWHCFTLSLHGSSMLTGYPSAEFSMYGTQIGVFEQ